MIMFQKSFYTVRDLQEISGESESCWRKRLGRRELPFIRFGNNVRVSHDALAKWLEGRTVSACDPANRGTV
jgi:hypothetical protein